MKRWDRTSDIEITITDDYSIAIIVVCLDCPRSKTINILLECSLGRRCLDIKKTIAEFK